MKKCDKKILPIFNRMVIFNTTETSYHGHPEPLICPPDRCRKSLALYYYTVPQGEHTQNHSTEFKIRPDEKKESRNKIKIRKYFHRLAKKFNY